MDIEKRIKLLEDVINALEKRVSVLEESIYTHDVADVWEHPIQIQWIAQEEDGSQTMRCGWISRQMIEEDQEFADALALVMSRLFTEE